MIATSGIPELFKQTLNLCQPKQFSQSLCLSKPSQAKPDKFIWSPNPKGNFPVHSLWVSYWPIKQTHKCRSTVEKAMETQEHLKGSRCCFGESVNTLPTKDNMPKRVEYINPTCVLCSQEEESCCHLFLHWLWQKQYGMVAVGNSNWTDITTCGGTANIVLNPPPPQHSFNQGRSLACMPKYGLHLGWNMVLQKSSFIPKWTNWYPEVYISGPTQVHRILHSICPKAHPSTQSIAVPVKTSTWTHQDQCRCSHCRIPISFRSHS